MNFKVLTADGTMNAYSDDARFKIGESNGVLEIWSSQAGKILLSPAAWMRIEEDRSDYDVSKSAY